MKTIAELRKRVLRAQAELNAYALSDIQITANIICNYFGIEFFTDLHEPNRRLNYIYARKFIALFVSALFVVTQDDLGTILNRDRTSARHHLVDVIKVIKIKDKLFNQYLEDLIQIFAKEDYDIKRIRQYIDEFNEFRPTTYFDRRIFDDRFKRRRSDELLPV